MKYENFQKARDLVVLINELADTQQLQDNIVEVVLCDKDENAVVSITTKSKFEDIDVTDTIGLAAYNLVAAIRAETTAKLAAAHTKLELL